MALFFIVFFALIFSSPMDAQTVVRGEVRIDLEPVYLSFLEEHGPLDTTVARQRALEEAFLNVSAHIYGWRFAYEIGERARQIEEKLELFSEGTIRWGDPRFSVTDARVEGSTFAIWVEYRPTPEEERRLAFWKSGQILLLQGVGTGALSGPGPAGAEAAPNGGGLPTVPGASPGEEGDNSLRKGRSTGGASSDSPEKSALSSQDGLTAGGWAPVPGPWYDGKRRALEDAARAAIRAYLRKTERNRPKEAHGYIALASFPRYWIQAGRWTCQARFRVIITDVVPFAVH